jgi:hypothetical protein
METATTFTQINLDLGFEFPTNPEFLPGARVIVITDDHFRDLLSHLTDEQRHAVAARHAGYMATVA